MTIIVFCPNCGMENSSDAKECTYCQIDLQYASEHPEELVFKPAIKTNETKSNSANWLLIGFLAGLIPNLFLLASGGTSDVIGFVLCFIGGPGMLGGIIGAAIGNAMGKKKEIKTVVITAVVGAFLGSGLMFLIVYASQI